MCYGQSHVRHLKNRKLKVGGEYDLFEAGEGSSRELAGEPENKRIAGTNKDKVLWSVRFLKE